MRTIKLRNGITKRLRFPIRITAEGSIEPYAGKSEADIAKIVDNVFFNHKEQKGYRAGDRSEMMKIAGEKLDMVNKDAEKMRAKGLHELLCAWENYHRILTAEAHLKHIEFHQGSCYPDFYYRTDKNFIDEENWHSFINSIYDNETKQ